MEKLRAKWLISKFSEKTVFITGCDTGFGFLAAKRFDSMGFKVIAGCLTREGADKLTKESSGRISSIIMDVTNEQSVSDGFEQIKKLAPNGLWAVINNAGLYDSWIVEVVSMKTVKRLFDVNIIGLINVCKLSIPFVRKTKGRIINVASVVGRFAPASVAPYAATKYAVEGFSESLRTELSIWGIKVILIEPGIMKTNLYDEAKNDSHFDKMYDELDEQLKRLYGKEYLNHVRRRLLDIVDFVSGDPNVVVEGMVKAVTQKYPKFRYMLGDDKFFWLFVSYAPTRVTDGLFKLLSTKVVKPAALLQKK
jgi:NAD(P)-dependent dehydrogenase (short-subunit alcohol dehydrogenase family)